MLIHSKLLSEKKVKMGGTYFIANIINKAIAFITIPIFTRLLTAGEYGSVSTYAAYVAIFQYFMGLSSEYTVRNAYVDFRNEIPQYLSSMYLLASYCSVIVSLIILVINRYGLHISTTLICSCCVAQAFMTYVNNAMSNKLMMDGEYTKRAFIMAIPNLLSAVMGIVFILIIPKDKVLGRVMGSVVAVWLVGIWCLVVCWRKSPPKFSKKYWNYILKISPPLVLHGLSLILLSQFDRIMITKMVSSAETGIYSIIYSLSMVAMAVTTALEGVWTPWFTKQYMANAYNVINSKAKQYLFVASTLITGIMLVAPEVLRFITPESYWSGINMIPLLCLSSFFIYTYSFCINLELIERKTKRIASVTVIAAIVNVSLNYVFIPYYGGTAAAGTTLVAYILSFALHYRYGRKLNKKLFPLSVFSVSLIQLIIAVFVFYFARNLLIIRWLLALTIIGMTIRNYKTIISDESKYLL